MASIKSTLYKGDHVFELKYSWQLNHRQEFDIRRGSNNNLPSINLKLSTHTIDLNWEHPEWNGFDGESGFSWLYHDNNNLPGTNTIPFLPNYNDSRYGLYLLESRKFGKQTVEIGFRYDLQNTSVRGRQIDNQPYFNDLNFRNLTSSVGYTIAFNEKLSFNTNLGTAWRSPNVSELYGFGKHGATIQYGLWRYLDYGGANIDATMILDETDKKVHNEVGYKWLNQLSWKGTDLTWNLNGYVHLINHYIFATPRGITTTTRGAFPYFTYRQTDALIAGIDAELNYSITSDLNLGSNMSYVYARDIRYDNYFVEIPPLNLVGKVTYTKEGRWMKHFFDLDLSYTFKKQLTPKVISPDEILIAYNNGNQLFENSDEIFDFQEAPNGYFLLGMGWEGTYKRFAVSAKANNMLNTTYRIYTDQMRYFATDMGVNFIFSIKYSL
ncbi:MAG: TonB-dependent receptor domain-containing protein [Bacteroidota bacterium]